MTWDPTILLAKRRSDVRTVLVVDDMDVVRKLFREYIRQFSGYRVVAVKNVRAALKVFEKLQPVAIISDILLEDFTGEVLCDRVRSWCAENHVDPPLMVAISGYGPSYRSDCFDTYLDKPIDLRRLVEHLSDSGV